MLWKLKDCDFLPRELSQSLSMKGKKVHFQSFSPQTRYKNRGRFAHVGKTFLSLPVTSAPRHFLLSVPAVLFLLSPEGNKRRHVFGPLRLTPLKSRHKCFVACCRRGIHSKRKSPVVFFFKCSVWKTCTEKWVRYMWPRQIPRSLPLSLELRTFMCKYPISALQ